MSNKDKLDNLEVNCRRSPKARHKKLIDAGKQMEQAKKKSQGGIGRRRQAADARAGTFPPENAELKKNGGVKGRRNWPPFIPHHLAVLASLQRCVIDAGDSLLLLHAVTE